MAVCFDRNECVANKLEMCLYAQMLAGEFCDINLYMGDVTYKVHSCVLASFSSYFNNLIKSLLNTGQHALSTGVFMNSVTPNETLFEKWSYSNPLKICLSDIFQESNQCALCTSSVLDFIYLGKLHIHEEHRKHIQKLGEVLQIPEISEICEKFNTQVNDELTHKVNYADTTLNATEGSAEVKGKDHGFNIDKFYLTDTCIESENDDLGSIAPVPAEKNSYSDDIAEKNYGSSGTISQTFTNVCHNKTDKPRADTFMCFVCSHKFPSEQLLKEHSYYHIGHLYRCYTCKFYSHKAHDLYQHLKSANHKETVCSFCMFEAETSETLIGHIENHSHPEKPFVCSECNNRYSTRARLKEHSSKHSHVGSFVCAICNKSFKRKSGLQSHMNVHSMEKKYLCSYCGFRAAHRASLRRHQLEHNGVILKCQWESCTFKTSDKNRLQLHFKLHTKQKDYQCEICGHSFSQLRNLRRHATRHVNSGCSEYCPLCHFKSERVDKLILHFKRCHPTEDLKALKTSSKRIKFEKSKTMLNAHTSTEETNNRFQEKGIAPSAVKESYSLPIVQKNRLSTDVSVGLQNKTKNIIIFTNVAPSNSSISNNVAVNAVPSSNKVAFLSLSNNSCIVDKRVYSYSLMQQKNDSGVGNLENIQLSDSRQETTNDLFSDKNSLRSNKHSAVQTLNESVSGESNKSLLGNKKTHIQSAFLNNSSSESMSIKYPMNPSELNRAILNSTTGSNLQELLLNSIGKKVSSKNTRPNLNIHVSQTPTNILETQIINYDSLLESLENTQLDLPTLDDNVTILSAVNDLHRDLETPISFISNSSDVPFRKLVQNNSVSHESSDITNLKHNSASDEFVTDEKVNKDDNCNSDAGNVSVSNVKNHINLNSNSSDSLSLNMECLSSEPQQNIQFHEESSFDVPQPLFQSLETFLDFDDI